jgi:hypothetical protein
MSTRRRRICSIVVRVAVFLLLGAIVNIAIAWGLSCGVLNFGNPSRETQRAPDDTDVALWRQCAVASAAPTPAHSTEFAPVGLSLRSIHEIDPFNNPAKAGHMLEWTQAGWPMYAMQGGVFHDLAKRNVEWHSLFWRENTPIGWVNVPLRPMWIGFVVNTMIYAAALWLIVALVFALRRWRRIRRGLCARCAYPVGPGMSEVCPECGAAIRPGGAAACSHG